MQRRPVNFSPHARGLTAACLALGLAAALTSPAHAVLITIDKFTAPVTKSVQAIGMIQAGPKVLVKQDDPEILGLERDVLFEVNGTPNPSSYMGTIGAGKFVYAAGTEIGTTATLQYDGKPGEGGSDDVQGANPSLTDNLKIGGATPFDLTAGFGQSTGKFVLEFLSAQCSPIDDFFTIEITAVSSGGTAVFTGNVQENPNPFDYEVAFSQFTPTGDFDFGELLSLKFVFNKGNLWGVDFELDAITVEVVPEPGTLVLCGWGGLALVGMGFRRRRKQPSTG